MGPAFIPKGRVGRHARSISRSGLILLMDARPRQTLDSGAAEVHLGIWRRVVLPGQPPEPYGIVLVLRAPQRAGRAGTIFQARLGQGAAPGAALCLDVGAGQLLSFVALQAGIARPIVST